MSLKNQLSVPAGVCFVTICFAGVSETAVGAASVDVVPEASYPFDYDDDHGGADNDTHDNELEIDAHLLNLFLIAALSLPGVSSAG